MTRLERLRELRRRIDQEITRELACQRRVGQIVKEAAVVQRNPDQHAAILMRASADHFGVPVATLSSTRRTRRATSARMVAAWTIRTGLGLSYPEIGRLLSKDHTTVMNAVKRVEADAALRAAGAHLLREAEAAA